MNGPLYTGSWDYLGRGVPTDWKIVGIADFNGDGKKDLLWQNNMTGDVTVWYMNGPLYTGKWDYLGKAIPTQWKIVGIADLDGDGKKDLIWQNTTNGDVSYWFMDGIKLIGSGYIARAIHTDWKIVGSADLNGDGKNDMIWHNSTTGDVSVWYMNGTDYTGNWSYIARGVPTAWKIAAIMDINNDGNADLIWQNSTTGDATVWYMNGAQWTGTWDYVAHGVPTDWKIVRTH